MPGVADSLPLTEGQRRLLRRLRRPAWLGTLRRLTPLSDVWGFDRGTPIDRYYIEQFLARHASHVRGRVIEIRDDTYTHRFGRDITSSEVLDINEANPRATIIDDLTICRNIPSGSIDCLILTQTLQFIADAPAALAQAKRILAPGGALLCTVPAISPLASQADFWRFTPPLLRSLLERSFAPPAISIESYGNVLTGLSFLTGISAEELRPTELARQDARFPLLIAALCTTEG